MANPIKYSASVQTNSIQIGNFWIGAAEVDRGPSEITGYYQGYSPSPGGYVIYLFNSGAPGNLSYHNAPDDTELIRFTNDISGQSFSTPQDCFDYYSSQSDKKLVNQNFPPNFPLLVMNGLVLYLDAGIALSYPGTGTTWNDINGLGSRNNGTLVGPTFEGGNFLFNGSSDYLTLDRNILSDGFTISFWIKPAPENTNIQTLFSNTTGGFTTDGIRIFFNSFGTSDKRIYIESANGSAGEEIKSTTGIIIDDEWQFVSFAIDRAGGTGKIYHNSVEVASGLVISDFKIPGTNYIGLMTTNFPYDGRILSLQVYNKILTSLEIQENYEASQIYLPT